MRKNWSTVLLVLILLFGMALLLYPTVSDYWNSLHQSRAIADYTSSVAVIDNNKYEELLDSADSYNRDLAQQQFHIELTDEETARYNSILDITGTGIMAYVEIPKVKCALPVYHGTNEAVLSIAIGHIAGTSFPVGGESTHTVLSGHRGLPSAKLFTDLDQLVIGDQFLIRTLDLVLTYQIDQILTVLPYELEPLAVVPGQDLCTLVTCTPYGVNTHRLLVRGHRVETEAARPEIRITADAVQIQPSAVAPFAAAPILLVLFIMLMTGGKKTPSDPVSHKKEE